MTVLSFQGLQDYHLEYMLWPSSLPVTRWTTIQKCGVGSAYVRSRLCTPPGSLAITRYSTHITLHKSWQLFEYDSALLVLYFAFSHSVSFPACQAKRDRRIFLRPRVLTVSLERLPRLGWSPSGISGTPVGVGNSVVSWARFRLIILFPNP